MTRLPPSSEQSGTGRDRAAAILAERVSTAALPAGNLAAALSRHRTPTGREILATVEEQRRTYLAHLGLIPQKDPRP